MRVLMVNRSDACSRPGGDTVQMQKTCEALRKLGHIVDIKLANSLNDGQWNYDVAHVFNIQRESETWNACRALRSKGIKIAVSPIYWDPLPNWFRTASIGRPVWRTLRSTFGYGISFRSYTAWHRARNIRRTKWRTQREVLMMADALLPNSTMESIQISKDFFLGHRSHRKSITVPNAIDPTAFDPLPAPNHKLLTKFGDLPPKLIQNIS